MGLGQVIPPLPQNDPYEAQRTGDDERPLPSQCLHCPYGQRRRDNGPESGTEHKNGDRRRALVGRKPLRDGFARSGEVSGFGNTQHHSQGEKTP